MRLEIGKEARVASPARPGLREKLPLPASAVDSDFFGLFKGAIKPATPGDVPLMLRGAHCCFLSGIKNAPGWVLRVSCPRVASRLRSVHVSRAVVRRRVGSRRRTLLATIASRF